MTDIRELLDDYEARARHVMANDLPDMTGCSEFSNLMAAMRAVLDIVNAMPHDLNEEDCWYACAQAKDPYTGEWASCNDSRAGGPCDCGRGAFVAKVSRAIADALSGVTQ